MQSDWSWPSNAATKFPANQVTLAGSGRGTPPFPRSRFLSTHLLFFISLLQRVVHLQFSAPAKQTLARRKKMGEGIDRSLEWTFGLLNSGNRYLTAESFQHKVTGNGTTLKKKQIWTLVRQADGVALKCHAGTYLTIDKDGNISAAADEVGADQTLNLITQDDGKVAIMSVKHKRYLGGSGDNISGFDLSISTTNLFIIHLAMHPQINLYNVCRRTFCHLVENELRCKEVIPWGFDALITIEFHEGTYALRAANGKVLQRTGALADQVSNDSLYTIVFRDAQVAFRDCNGKYLTAVGAMATMQSRKDTIGKDECFLIMDSHPQMSFVACNGKLVSLRDGLEVRANQPQDDMQDTEIFQMEAVDRTDKSGNCKWVFRGNNKKYWSSNPGIKADQESIKENCQFEVEWHGPLIALKGDTGKYVSVKSNGKMSADSKELTDECKFVFDFINRPLLVLRGSFGFVGVKGARSGILECNRSHYDLFHVTCVNGVFHIQGSNGKYMGLDASNNVTITSDTPVDFLFELRAHTHMVIRAPNGNYLEGSQNGGFTATGTSINSKTLWEY